MSEQTIPAAAGEFSELVGPESLESEEQRGPIEIRAAGEILEASFAERTIEIVVIPYERETRIRHAGRTVREVVSRGAFAGIERRAGRARKVRVNYQHRDGLEDLLGTASELHPGRPEGLVASLKILDGPEGDRALRGADAGILAASAGFGVMPGGERWEERGTLRRLTRLFLDHVALTPTPAYPGTDAIAVRSDEPPARGETPNLDLWRSLALEDRLGSDPLFADLRGQRRTQP